MSAHRTNIILLSVFAVISIFLSGRLDITNPQYDLGDWFYYLSMAETAPVFNAEVISPFAYRIAGPWLAGTLFENVYIGFTVLNFISLFLIPVLIYFFLQEEGVSKITSLGLSIATIFNRYFFQFAAWNGFHVADTWAFVFIIIALILMKRRKILLLLLIMPIGMLFKEYLLLLIPMGYVYLLKNKSTNKNYMGFTIASVFSISIFILLRQFIPVSGGEGLYEQITTTFASEIIKPLSLPKRLIIAFVPFGLIPFIFFKSFAKFCRENLHYFIFFLSVIAISFIGVDGERLAVTALPVYLVFIGNLFDKLTTKLYTTNKRNWLIQLVIISIISSVYHIWGILKLPNSMYSAIYTMIILILMSVIFIYLDYLNKKLHKR